MWTRNDNRHNNLSSDAKMRAARSFWIESMLPYFETTPGIFGVNDLMREVADGRHDGVLGDHVRTLNSATRVSNSVQALMYLRGYHAPFDRKNPYEATRYVPSGGSSWTHGYLMRHSPYTRDAELNRHSHPGAHKPKSRYTYDDDGEVICSDPRGHSMVFSDENENVCYCSRCGCAEY